MIYIKWLVKGGERISEDEAVAVLANAPLEEQALEQLLKDKGWTFVPIFRGSTLVDWVDLLQAQAALAQLRAR